MTSSQTPLFCPLESEFEVYVPILAKNLNKGHAN